MLDESAVLGSSSFVASVLLWMAHSRTYRLRPARGTTNSISFEEKPSLSKYGEPDTYMVSRRTGLTAVTAVLYCPDLLKNLISRIETGEKAAVDEDWATDRVHYNLAIQ